LNIYKTTRLYITIHIFTLLLGRYSKALPMDVPRSFCLQIPPWNSFDKKGLIKKWAMKLPNIVEVMVVELNLTFDELECFYTSFWM
jgi:hypothetical protein